MVVDAFLIYEATSRTSLIRSAIHVFSLGTIPHLRDTSVFIHHPNEFISLIMLYLMNLISHTQIRSSYSPLMQLLEFFLHIHTKCATSFLPLHTILSLRLGHTIRTGDCCGPSSCTSCYLRLDNTIRTDNSCGHRSFQLHSTYLRDIIHCGSSSIKSISYSFLFNGPTGLYFSCFFRHTIIELLVGLLQATDT